MNNEHKIILDLLTDYLEQHPDQRFGQAIFNLRINEFKDNEEYQLRDIYNDSDSKIINRIESQLYWFNLQSKVRQGLSKIDGIGGMTVNERLFASGLLEIFDEVKITNKEYARFILRSLKVDEESITQILK